ncbi:MAG: UPF0182 family protein, partial [Thermoanaerobaculia bacterium]
MTTRGRRPRRRGRLGWVLAPVLLLVVSPALTRLYADVLWFREIGFSRVLATHLAARAALFAGVALLAFGFLYANARLAQRRRASRPILLQLEGPEGPPRDLSELVWRATLLAALAAAALFGLSASAGWLTVLRALHATPFGTADPIFGRDVAYYVFSLPL